MKRYTRSFIGLMERSYEGDWCKVEDSIGQIESIDKENSKLHTQLTKAKADTKNLQAQVVTLESLTEQLHDRSNTLHAYTCKTKDKEVPRCSIAYFLTVQFGLTVLSLFF